jgi:LysM repeat protein
MRRDLPTTPFDVEADDLTQQFWGASKGWLSSEQPTVRRRDAASARPTVDRPAHPAAGRPPAARDDTTGSLRVIREGFAAFRPQTSVNATGEITRRRSHGEPRRRATASHPTVSGRREATLGELAAGRAAATHHEHPFAPAPTRRGADRELEAEYDVPLTPLQPLTERLGLGAVDPLLLRAGALLLALILLVPVVLSLRPDRADSLPGDVVEAPQQVVAGAAPTAADTVPVPSATEQSATTSGVTEQAPATGQSATTPAGTAAPSAATTPTAESVVATTPEEPAVGATSEAGDAGAEVDVLAERVVPACPQTYTAATGDSWYRIADAAGVAPQELLAENNATTDTVILPGDDICLPAGAAMPTPPTTDAPAASDAPTSTESTTPDATEPAPTSTEAPETTAPSTTVAPVANLSRSEVQELIRQTWPADEVETALAVARRESNFVATADNGWCCVGVFQIYWSVHRGWLDDFGITERSDLFDARKNIAAAYAMWQRSGWGPWGG